MKGTKWCSNYSQTHRQRFSLLTIKAFEATVCVPLALESLRLML